VTLKNGHSVVERQLKIDRLWGPHKRLFFVVREIREEQQRFWFGMCSVFFLFFGFNVQKHIITKKKCKQQRKERERIDVYATIEEEIKLFRRYELDYYYY
jgi:hypothetical protein